MAWMKKPPVFLATDYLQQYDTEAKDIGFQRILSVYGILWRHIATTSVAKEIDISSNIYTYQKDISKASVYLLTRFQLLFWFLLQFAPHQRFLPVQNLKFWHSYHCPAEYC